MCFPCSYFSHNGGLSQTFWLSAVIQFICLFLRCKVEIDFSSSGVGSIHQSFQLVVFCEIFFILKTASKLFCFLVFFVVVSQLYGCLRFEADPLHQHKGVIFLLCEHSQLLPVLLHVCQILLYSRFRFGAKCLWARQNDLRSPLLEHRFGWCFESRVSLIVVSQISVSIYGCQSTSNITFFVGWHDGQNYNAPSVWSSSSIVYFDNCGNDSCVKLPHGSKTIELSVPSGNESERLSSFLVDVSFISVHPIPHRCEPDFYHYNPKSLVEQPLSKMSLDTTKKKKNGKVKVVFLRMHWIWRRKFLKRSLLGRLMLLQSHWVWCVGTPESRPSVLLFD